MNNNTYIYIIKVKAFTYIQQGKFGFTEKVKPTIIDEHDAIVRVTLSRRSSLATSLLLDFGLREYLKLRKRILS